MGVGVTVPKQSALFLLPPHTFPQLQCGLLHRQQSCQENLLQHRLSTGGSSFKNTHLLWCALWAAGKICSAMENLLPSLTLIFPSLFPTPFVPSLSLSLSLWLFFPFLKISFCSADEFSCVLPRVPCRAAGAVCVQNREAPHLIPQRAPCTTITTKTLQMHPTHLVLPKVE